MTLDYLTGEPIEPERKELSEEPTYQFDLNRRQFVGVLGAGLLFSFGGASLGQQRRGRGRGQARARRIAERIHIDTTGLITVMTGKVEVGQGSRTQIAQAAAEELRVKPESLQMILADTLICPDDGGTFGSRTTPSTIPTVRRGAAAAREFLIDMAAAKWSVDRTGLTARDGKVVERNGSRSVTYGELSRETGFLSEFSSRNEGQPEVTAVEEWKILGAPVGNLRAKEIVTGAQEYPSDIRREGMLYGKVLRPPCWGGELKSIDLGPAQAMEGVTVVRDGNFVGCTAPTSWAAQKAVDAIASSAQWDCPPHPSSRGLSSYLRENAQTGGGGGRGRGRGGGGAPVSIEAELEASAKTLKAEYAVAYIQHAPMEPRAAVAEWADGKLTVWTGTQNPTRVAQEIAGAMRVDGEAVRVIVPDTGGGFGGKHTGEVGVEASRLAKAAGRPVSLTWTREEEFMWAYFRPAGVIDVAAGLDRIGAMTAWSMTNLNSGRSAVASPYDVSVKPTQYTACNSPLREGSYRGLAATANTFARESFMDELADAGGVDPLEFRLAHLESGGQATQRLRTALESVAERFDWSARSRNASANRGVGLACGIEKGSYCATCVEVEVDPASGAIEVLDIVQSYECGKIQNPANLLNQVEGSIVMGLGGALTEEIRFENGKVLNGRFSQYFVPRFEDVPPIECVLMDRPDLPSVGAGETPIIGVAPAIGNAVFAATGVRLRSLPMKAEELAERLRRKP